MSTPQGVWGKRNSHSAARTPQNRSNTASPSQQSPSQPPKQETKPPTNVWQQRASANANANANANAASSSNGLPTEEPHKPVNGFNLAEIQAYAAQQYVPPTYKLPDTQGGRNSATPWGHKAGSMASGKSFFAELAKQVATLEGGG
ncbi:hypothetical protein DOTSEDRAFT_84422 [Dothistroma septosporum NZE10]|uniref:Uncharacterized protein n=1 Tax=Dothistroma septosporum (strain NZE10 / CBS 128990) TaxID=675120 RepID=N1Q354_DOTSN|nr:hypothetical protein DOTSEDRAFT_84422 [Dothistroma septosporum NZE10]